MTIRPAPARVAADTLAAIFADDENRLAALIAGGRIEQAADGTVPLISAVQVYLADLRSALRDRSATASAERARAARADAAELRLAEARRDLIPTEDAEHAVDLLCGAVQTALGSLPARCTRDIPLRRRIEAEVSTVQGTIARDVAAKGRGR